MEGSYLVFRWLTFNPTHQYVDAIKIRAPVFTLQLSEGLSRPQQKFVGQMLFGIQASQDVKLSNIVRTFREVLWTALQSESPILSRI